MNPTRDNDLLQTLLIVRAIYDAPGQTVPRLMLTFDASKSTILRRLAAARQLGAKIESVRGAGYRLVNAQQCLARVDRWIDLEQHGLRGA